MNRLWVELMIAVGAMLVYLSMIGFILLLLVLGSFTLICLFTGSINVIFQLECKI